MESLVIVGASLAGLSAARALSNREGVRVTLLDKRNHHLFQPLLYQVATATLSAGDIASPILWVLRRARNVRVLLGEASRIDVAAKEVHLTDGARIPYDQLIVATGASHVYFGHPEWERVAPGLKTLEDAFEIRRRVLTAFERAERETDHFRRRELLTFVLVGGGPTGVELAGTMAEIANQTLRDEFRSIDTGPSAMNSLRAFISSTIFRRRSFFCTTHFSPNFARYSLKRCWRKGWEGMVVHFSPSGSWSNFSGSRPAISERRRSPTAKFLA